MSSIWIVMICVGLLTFLTRFSFIALLERWQTPPLVQRGLRFVPIAVLSAIIAPEILIRSGGLEFSPLANDRLIPGLAATLVAWKTKNVVWTILAGMGTFWLLKIFF
jgi:branched-subunit amino acid transport protein